MHKSDYLAQVEALRASPELRARVAGLAGTPARRRRLRPWMGVCACLAVLLLGGTLLLPRLGGQLRRRGGHAGGSIFQSYAGPVFPLTTLEDAGLTARRTITLDFAPWGDGHTTDIDVTDSYVLTNPTDTDQSVTLVYPFSGSFYALYPPTLTADGAALDAVIRPGVGGSQSLESWEEYAALVEGNDLAAAHAEIPALDTPVTVYAFTDLTRPESDAAAPTLAVTYPWSEDTPAVLTYGFHGSSIDREAGWARRSFSLPEPDSPPRPGPPPAHRGGRRSGGLYPPGLPGRGLRPRRGAGRGERRRHPVRVHSEGSAERPLSLPGYPGPQVRRRDGRRVPLQGGIF